jgi:hypothetical protein
VRNWFQAFAFKWVNLHPATLRLDGLFGINEAGSNPNLESLANEQQPPPAATAAAAAAGEGAAIGGTGGGGSGTFGSISETEVTVEVSPAETEGMAADLASMAAALPQKPRTFMKRTPSKHRALNELVALVDADLVLAGRGGVGGGGKNRLGAGASVGSRGSMDLNPGGKGANGGGGGGGARANAGDNGDGVDRRRALRSVARDVENLMLISEALAAKEMPGLSLRLKEGLVRIQNNVRAGYKNEGLSVQKRSAMRRVNRLQMIGEMMQRRPSATLELDDNGTGGGGGGSLAGSRSSGHGGGEGGHKDGGGGDGSAVSFKMHCVRAFIVGFVLLIICCVPHILHQYEPDHFLEASHVTVGGVNGTGHDALLPHVLPLSVGIHHSSKGLYEVTMGAGRCMAAAPAAAGHHYYATVKMVQDGNIMASGKLKLHDLGNAVATGAGGGHRRSLLSGGGGGAPPGADVYDTFYFDVGSGGDGYDRNGGAFSVEVESDCPQPLGLSLEVKTIGPVGSAQHWVALVLLIVVFGLIILEVERCKLNAADPWLESAWFQPLHLSSEKPVSKYAFQIQLAPLHRGGAPHAHRVHGGARCQFLKSNAP